MGVTSPSVKKGIVAPVERQNSGEDMSGLLCPGGIAAPGAWLKALGDMVTGCPEESCWEWLFVGISSLTAPPAHKLSSRCSSAGGAVGVIPAAPLWSGVEATVLDGEVFKVMLPM